MTDSDQKICVLKEDNLQEWLVDAKALLRSKKLWEYTLEPLPTPDDDALETAKTKTLRAKHEEAADLLTPRISSIVKQKLIPADFDDVHLMIKHIKELYAPATDYTFMRASQELFTLRPNGDLDEFLTKIKVLSEKIDATNIELTKDKRTLLVLMMGLSYDEDYKSLVQVWSATEGLTAEKAIAMVREESRKEKDKDSVANQHIRYERASGNTPALYEGMHSCKKCGKKGHLEERCFSDKECWYCKKHGHIERICRQKKEDEEKEKKVGGPKSSTLLAQASHKNSTYL